MAWSCGGRIFPAFAPGAAGPVRPGEITRDGSLAPMALGISGLARALKAPRQRLKDIAPGRRWSSSTRPFGSNGISGPPRSSGSTCRSAATSILRKAPCAAGSNGRSSCALYDGPRLRRAPSPRCSYLALSSTSDSMRHWGSLSQEFCSVSTPLRKSAVRRPNAETSHGRQ